VSRSSLSFRWCPQPGKTFGSGLVEKKKKHPAPITSVGGGISASHEIVIVYQLIIPYFGKVSGIPNLALKNSSLGDFIHHAVG